LKSPSELEVAVTPEVTTTAIVYQASGSSPNPSSTLILGHGAGAGQKSPFMVDFARALSSQGLDVVTFNFLYMERRRRLPDRAPVLESCYAAVISAVRDSLASAQRFLFVGGKSMGGRIATQIAAAQSDLALSGLVLLGYPLHPPGRPDKRRDAHLSSVGRPMLFVQGSRDAFGTPAELEPIVRNLGDSVTMYVIEGGDHSFKLAGGNRDKQAAVYVDAQQTILRWIAKVTSRSAPGRPRSA
jgi:predicted alpha/beta-hydrolase family hydrolase